MPVCLSPQLRFSPTRALPAAQPIKNKGGVDAEILPTNLFSLLQVVLHLCRRQHVELLVLLDDAHLNVGLIHLHNNQPTTTQVIVSIKAPVDKQRC